MSLLAALLGIYALICLSVYIFQSRLVYFPEAEIVATPDDVGLEYRDIFFRTEDGVDLHGWWVFAPEQHEGEPSGGPIETQTLLFFHGNAGNISHRLPLIQTLVEEGISVFIFDYRGYGQSQGTPGEAGTYRDAHAAWRHLTETEGLSADHIALYGRSIGGAVAIELATRVQPRALIVDSSFTSAVELGTRVYWWLPVKWLARIRYDSLSRVRDLTCPKLFMHSPNDEVVPFALGRRLFERAGEPKRFLELRGGHNDEFMGLGMSRGKAIAEFLDQVE